MATAEGSDMKMLSSKEVQDLFGISYPTLCRWINDGKLHPHKAGRFNRFEESEVAELLGVKVQQKRHDWYPQESKQQICDHLLMALKSTDYYHDLHALEYERTGRVENVTAYFEGEKKVINVTASSGVTMIGDIVKGLAS